MSEKIRKHRVNKVLLRKRAYQQRIVDAAIVLFTRQGVDQTPITAIIKEAGVAHKTFFNHFPNKHQLMMHIAEQYFAGMEAIVREVSRENDDAVDILQRSFIMTAETIDNLDERTGRMLGHLVLHAHVGQGYDKFRIIGHLKTVVTDLMQQACRQGHLKADFSLAFYAELVTSIFVGVITNWANDENYPLVQHMTLASTFVVQTVFTGQQVTGS